MQVEFRQGIIKHGASGGIQTFLFRTGSNVSFSAGNGPTIVTYADGTSDYTVIEEVSVTNAWVNVPNEAYLYWDIDRLTSLRTFGFTLTAPIVSTIEPVNPTVGQHWYDLNRNKMKEYTAFGYVDVIRVFAGVYNLSSFSPIAGASFTGTQVGINTAVRSGRILLQVDGKPLRKGAGSVEFVTSETDFFLQGSQSSVLRLDTEITNVKFTEPVGAYQVVALSNAGASLANYNQINGTVIGLTLNASPANAVDQIVLQGTVRNPLWTWATTGAPLWPDAFGVLVEVDPNTTNAAVFNKSKPPVARVVDAHTIIFQQGLGGIGERGQDGSAGGVTSVGLSAPSFLSVSSSPVTSVGTLTLDYSGEPLSDLYGGTGLTSLSAGIPAFLASPTSENFLAAVLNSSGNGSIIFSNQSVLTSVNVNLGSISNVSLFTSNIIDPILSGGTLSGGSIDDSPIGATTPSTGNFTNLSINGVPISTGGGGTSLFTQTEFTNSPNDSVINQALIATSSANNISVSLVPKGSGGVSLRTPDGGSAGGNARGSRAVDLQILRSSNTQVASGSDSFIAGNDNTASGPNSSALGYNNTASGGGYNLAAGDSNTSSGFASIVGGSSNVVAADYSTAFGRSNNITSTARNSIAVGTTNLISSTESNSNGSVAIGYDNQITGTAQSAVTLGRGNRVSRLYTIALGRNNFCTVNQDAIAIGNNNTSSGVGAVYLGDSGTSSGTSSVGLGSGHTASGNFSLAGGNSCTASGLYSLAVGNQCRADGVGSVAFGTNANTRTRNYSMSFANSSTITAQQTLMVITASTTNNTSTIATTNNSTATTSNQFVLSNNTAVRYSALAVARDQSTGDTKEWQVDGLIKRGSTAATTTLVGTPVSISTFGDTATSAWTLVSSADTTNGALQFTVVGGDTNNTRLNVSICAVEVG